MSHSVISNSLPSHRLYPTRLLCPWDSPDKNTGVGCHALLQGIFLTQGLKPGPLHCGWIRYHLSHQGSPLITLFQDNWFPLNPMCFIHSVPSPIPICRLLFWFFFSTVMGLPCGPQALEHTGSVVVACGLSCSKTCGMLVPRPGIKPAFPELQGGFLISGQPGQSLVLL